MPLPFRVRIGATLLAALTGAGLLAVPAGANPEAPERTGESVAPCRTGLPLRYLVLFPAGTTAAEAESQVKANCGATTAYYPEIGVAVAGAADPDFVSRLGADRVVSAEAQIRAARKKSAGRGPAGPRLAPDRRPAGTDRTDEQWDMAAIRADQANQVTVGSRDVLVGVLDSGVDAGHPDLAAAVDPAASAGCVTGRADQRRSAWLPTESPHGTHVAGTIAAAKDGRGITGVAPGVRLASVKVVDDDGYVYPESVVCGFMWAAAKGMRVVNNSFLVDPWVLTCRDRAGQRVVHEAVSRAVRYAVGRGVLAVAAVGNDAVDLANPGATAAKLGLPGGRVDNRCEALPAELRGVVAVSSVGAEGVKASYSSYGLGVAQLTAPGGDHRQTPPGLDNGCVLSTVPHGGYGYLCGTSMATPHVTGVAALLASRYRSASPAQLTRLLGQQAVSLDCPADYDLNSDGAQDATCNGYAGYNGFYGHGMVDALAAVRD
ncbi:MULTISPECIES: S8 family serine peptidase [unclassified Crossiella]|uniref:S8 family peptidase n=1 Tax=unclassified Crossiella TaxID=2620835 RepID=UPI001FFE98AB|nr:MULTISPECIES: S8 family serine peptidase [unclassified Crossiella]MCK2241135.1 S8 family serine peptidase [Crossiella sp. S99.2]MCK2253721.1 S8 family serine peptidase [Crossiella sp. S99.1]